MRLRQLFTLRANKASPSVHIRALLTRPEEAVAEIMLRQEDVSLQKKVEKYLAGDIPEHFRQRPVAYLARHVATPNFETLRFIDHARELGLPCVIGEDGKDIFTSRNSLKRSLGKLSIIKGKSRNTADIVEHMTVIDFSTAEGRSLRDIRTKFGMPLMTFHRELMSLAYTDNLTIADESSWIDRHNRGDLIEHYKQFLALFIVHGIMFEHYPMHDADESAFVSKILVPAFNFSEKYFGKRPLIVPLLPDETENLQDWEGYPSALYRPVKLKMRDL